MALCTVLLDSANGNTYAVRIDSFADLVEASLEISRQPRSPPRFARSEDAPLLTVDDLSWHYDYIGIDIQVASQRSLETFLAFCSSGELGDEQRRQPRLRLELRGVPSARSVAGSSTQNIAVSPAPLERSGSRADVTPAAAAPTRAKSSRPVAANSAAASSADALGAAASPLSPVAPLSPEVPNHVRAQQLLSSFAPPPPPPVPKVRTVVVDGSASAEIPFNPYLTPSITELRQRMWSVFSKQLEALAQQYGCTTPVTETNFLISFREVDNPVAADMDDDKDVALAGSIGKERGEAMLLFYVDVPPYDPLDTYISPITETTLHSPQRGLGVNQCHTPRRGKKDHKPIYDSDLGAIEGEEAAA